MTLSAEQRAFLSRTVRRVCDLDDTILGAFIDLFSARSLGEGEDFIREGDVGQHIGFVADGLLRSYYVSPRGEEYNKHFFRPGEVFAPLTSLVMKQPSPVYIGALLDSTIMLADHAALEDLYERYPLLNRLGRKLVEWAWIGKERRETQLIMLDATERYDAFLEEYPGLDQLIPQYHIASYLGISPVQLSRIRTRRGKNAPS